MIHALIADWLGDADAIRVLDAASAAQIRDEIRRRGAAAGLDDTACARLATAASELVHNQLRHAGGGVVGLRTIERDGVAGLEVIAADGGPGIADPTAALTGTVPAPGGLGVGLSAAYRLADELDADVRLGQGTCLWARVFTSPVPRREVAVFGRPHPHERVSGDDAVFVRFPDSTLVAVIDALGHGILAHDAAVVAMAEVRRRADQTPLAVLDACDHALQRTRGGVMAVARLDGAGIEHVSSGNIATRLAHRDGTVQLFGGASRVVGSRQPPRRIPVERSAIEPGMTLILATDGLTSRIDLGGERELLRQPALVVAHQLVQRFARDQDDALVLVAR